jgi:hypothetical protein
VFVEVNSPSFNVFRCVVKRQEPIFVEAFSPNASVEGFDECVVRWFSGPAEVKCHTITICPLIQNFRRELGAVVDANHFWQRSIHCQSIQRRNHFTATHPLTDLDGKTLASKVIDYPQQTHFPAVEEFIRNEVHRPEIVDVIGIWAIETGSTTDSSLGSLRWQTQWFFAIKPMNSLGVHVPSFSTKKDMQTSMAVVNSGRSEFFQTHSLRGVFIFRGLVAMARAS